MGWARGQRNGADGIELDESTQRPGLAGALEVRAPAAGEREGALSLLLTGRASGGKAAVRRFDDYLASQGLADAAVIGAWEAGRLVSVATGVMSPGRAAMVFVSRPRALGGDAAGAAAVVALCEVLEAGGVRLAQALLDVGQAAERRVLAAGGMSELATLHYLSRVLGEADRGEAAARRALTERGLRLEAWSEAAAGRFAAAVEASYEATLDCPALRGVRAIEDVMAGHRAAGRFDPSRWVLASDEEGEAAGVMLLTELPTEGSGELVYLGVPPRWRGRGVGSGLVRLGVSMMAEAGCGRLLLAVDRANGPALELYRGQGFSMAGRKHAWMRVLGDG
ncbi:MAG: GNAT family N-acetyltransferase [Planctomycetota bacterium]